MEWDIADAVERLDEIVDRALGEGPQRIRRGEQSVVVVAVDEFDRLVAGGRVGFEDLGRGRDETALDVARRIGVIGHAEGLDPELSTGREHLHGFGADRPDDGD